MGMDIHGLNPKMHKEITDYPTLMMIKSLEKKEEWDKRRDLLDDIPVRDKYWAEEDEYNKENKGIYFRNNCWWWRPLWDFCYNVAPELISSELWGDGHHNDGAGLNDEDAELLGELLLKAIKEGKAKEFKKHHEEHQKDEEFKYTFDADNVKDFAEFCIESGGFEIC